MNFLEKLALAGKVMDIYEGLKHLLPGQTAPFLLRTKIRGKMWKFEGRAGPE